MSQLLETFVGSKFKLIFSKSSVTQIFQKNSDILETISVITNDGRNIVGVLKGFDQLTNVILSNSNERVYSINGIEQVFLGLYIIRGDNVYVLIFLKKD